MIEVTGGEDDLWTEDDDHEEMPAQNDRSDFDALGTAIGEMYMALRRHHVPRKYAAHLCELMLKIVTGGTQ